MTNKLPPLLEKLRRHGAQHVDLPHMWRDGVVVWRIGADEEISETAIHLEEFSSSAARNAASALRVLERIGPASGARDPDLMTALKKYVEDTCEAIKVVDNGLKATGTSLAKLLFEVPGQAEDSEMSWRNLIGRREVIAHKLLTVNDNKMFEEALRDFGKLHQLLSRVYFVPTKTDLAKEKLFSPYIKAEIVRTLNPSKPGTTPSIGDSLIFVFEDAKEGFHALRVGRSEENKLLLALSTAPRRLHISVQFLKEI